MKDLLYEQVVRIGDSRAGQNDWNWSSYWLQESSVCGAGLSGKPPSALGFEKSWNLELLMGRVASTEQLTKEIPPLPAVMDAMVRFNLSLEN